MLGQSKRQTKTFPAVGQRVCLMINPGQLARDQLKSLVQRRDSLIELTSAVDVRERTHKPTWTSLQRLIDFGQGKPRLILVFAALVGVADGTNAVGLEEHELRDPFVGVNLGRKGGGIADFEGDLPAPLRFDR